MFKIKFSKHNIKKMINIIFLSIIIIWDIYFLVDLIFFSDKFRKPYVGINYKDYNLVNNNKKESDSLSVEEKAADFQFMIDFMYENYPLIHIDEEIYGIVFEEKNDKFRKLIEDTKNDFEFYLTLYKYFSTVKSAHTYLLFPDPVFLENIQVNNLSNIMENNLYIERLQYWKNLLYENVKNYNLDDIVKFKYIDGRYYETEFFDTYITHINGQPVQEFIDNHESILNKNFSFRKNALYFSSLIFNKVQGEPVSVRMNNGIEYNLYHAPEYEFSYIYNLNEEQPEIFYLLDEVKRICYYRIDSFQIRYLNKIRKLSEEIIEKKDSIDTVIFDIRNNNGGHLLTFIDGILDHFINKEYKFTYKYYVPFTEFHSAFKYEYRSKIIKNPVIGIKNKTNLYYSYKRKIEYGEKNPQYLKTCMY